VRDNADLDHLMQQAAAAYERALWLQKKCAEDHQSLCIRMNEIRKKIWSADHINRIASIPWIEQK